MFAEILGGSGYSRSAGRFEFVALESMERAVDLIVEIVKLNVRGL